MFSWIRKKVSLQKRRFQEPGFDLDLAYIGDRIIAMGRPSFGLEKYYRNPAEDVKRFLDSRHYDRYWVYNLCSEGEYNYRIFHYRVTRYPFDDHNPPPFDMIRQFCIDAEKWLNRNSENIVVVHCKAGKGRTGLMVCCLIAHMNFLSPMSEILRFYACERTYNNKGLTIPSQIRYANCYEQYLMTNSDRFAKVRIRPTILKEIHMIHCPLFLKGGAVSFSLGRLGSENDKRFSLLPKKVERTLIFELEPSIQIKGDIRLGFYKDQKLNFYIWFNTEFVTNEMHFQKKDIDKAFKMQDIRKKFEIVLFLQRPIGKETESDDENEEEFEERKIEIPPPVQEKTPLNSSRKTFLQINYEESNEKQIHIESEQELKEKTPLNSTRKSPIQEKSEESFERPNQAVLSKVNVSSSSDDSSDSDDESSSSSNNEKSSSDKYLKLPYLKHKERKDKKVQVCPVLYPDHFKTHNPHHNQRNSHESKKKEQKLKTPREASHKVDIDVFQIEEDDKRTRSSHVYGHKHPPKHNHYQTHQKHSHNHYK